MPAGMKDDRNADKTGITENPATQLIRPGENAPQAKPAEQADSGRMPGEVVSLDAFRKNK